MNHKSLALCLLTFLFLTALTALAWNDTGHIIIAELAWRKLSTGERNAITALLKQHPHCALLLAADLPKKAPETNEWIFLCAATWPDMVRPSRDAAHPKPKSITDFHRADWHYTNAPFVAPADLATTHPPAQGEGKILEAIAANEAILKAPLIASPRPSDGRGAGGEGGPANTGRTAAEKAVALCWLLHLYGDLHQPLHCVAWFSPEFPQGDRGGNGVAIRPQASAVVLHAFWDDALGGGESRGPRPSDGRGIKGEGCDSEHTADTIAEDPAHTTARLKKDLAHTTVAQWAEESIDTAEAFAYLEGKLNHAKISGGNLSDVPDASVPALNAGYEATADTIARRRAALAGRRLGAKLKALF